MALINVAKTALRLTTNALDDELADEIDACLSRMHLAGAEGADEDPLVKDAVRAFVRWQHDFCGRGDEWKTCFEELRDAMGLSDDYSPGAEGGARAVIFDTQITLRLFSYPIVNGQTTEKLERETTVWAARKSVNRAEYYQAAQAGKRTDAIFRMHSAEYGGEQQLVCGSDVFDVVRSYGAETEEVELTCKRRDGA